MHLFRAFMVFAVLVPVLAVGAENNAASSATKALHDLFDRDWEYQMEQNPLWASSLGDRRWNDKWSDESLGAIHARFEHSRGVLKELHTIDRVQLSPHDQVSYDIFEFNQKNAIESEQYKWYLIRTKTYS